MFKPFDFVYTHAVVCRVANSLKDVAFKQKEIRKKDAIDIVRAKEQHNEYISTLRKIGIDVIELQADETLPESVFVDCNAVICNGSALIAKPHLISRKKETDAIKCFLRKEGLNIIEITDPIATIDASDVLFTGREFFVGLSKRTNILGAKALASAFLDIPVSLIKLKKALHLKSYVCVAGPDLLAFGSSEIAKDILKQMKEIAEFKKYKIIIIPDDAGTNCIYINGTLLHCAQEEWPNSYDTFANKIDFPRIELKNSEFKKRERSLTCRTILFNKNKIFQNICQAINQDQTY